MEDLSRLRSVIAFTIFHDLKQGRSRIQEGGEEEREEEGRRRRKEGEGYLRETLFDDIGESDFSQPLSEHSPLEAMEN